jgi:hypothetical protein
MRLKKTWIGIGLCVGQSPMQLKFPGRLADSGTQVPLLGVKNAYNKTMTPIFYVNWKQRNKNLR